MLDARRIDNTGGSLAAAQHLAVTSSSDLTNTACVLAGNRGVTLAAQGLSNAGGRIESAAGAVSVDTGALENTRGQLFAATQLGIRATDVFSHTGSFYAAQDLVMALTGRLAHGGVIGAGRDATVSAAAIEGAASSLFAAGLRADGRLTEAGTLSLAAREILVAHGQNLAGGGLTLQAGQLDVAGSQTSAHGVTFVADRVDARAAEFLASGTFQARVGGLLDTRLARVSAQQVNIQAGSLDNADGELVHTGRDDMQLVLPGNLTNTRGRIASNGTTLRLGAETLDNSAGSIEHAGTGDLVIRTGAFVGTSGEIRSNGHLDLVASRVELDRARTAAERVSITADTISHRYGELHQTGSGLATLSAGTVLSSKQKGG